MLIETIGMAAFERHQVPNTAPKFQGEDWIKDLVNEVSSGSREA